MNLRKLLGGDPPISADTILAKAADPKEIRLVTIPNVEMMEVGEGFPLASGLQTFTEDDLRAAVAALDDPAVKAPRLKVGHADGRLDGEPAFGKFINIRLINDDQTMVGDLTGVPEWLAKIMPTAYPNRSVEGKLNFKTVTGKTHALVLTNVALLGVELPGISTLDDLRDYYTEEMPEGTLVLASYRDGQPVVANVEVEDIRRSFYDTVASPGTDKYWWWIRAVQVDPMQVIVEDEDEGCLYRVPYSTVGDEVTWSDPVRVEIQYVDRPDKVAASASTFYASAAESRPAERSTMDPKQLRVSLGLAEDASDADVTAAITAGQEARAAAAAPDPDGGNGDDETDDPPPPGTPPGTETREPAGVASSAPPNLPEGMVLVDAETLQQIKAGADRGAELWKKTQSDDRDRTIMAGVKEGKYPRARIEHYAKAWDADPEGTKALIASLAPGLVPTEELGANGANGETGPADEAYPKEWLSAQERRTVEAFEAGSLSSGPGTITSERVGGV